MVSTKRGDNSSTFQVGDGLFFRHPKLTMRRPNKIKTTYFKYREICIKPIVSFFIEEILLMFCFFVTGKIKKIRIDEKSTDPDLFFINAGGH
jgi:hypothetical protein